MLQEVRGRGNAWSREGNVCGRYELRLGLSRDGGKGIPNVTVKHRDGKTQVMFEGGQ